MGGLIMAKGTRRLKNHYNEEFSTWIAFYRQPDIVTIFDRGNTDISIWKDVVNYITDPNSPANGVTPRIPKTQLCFRRRTQVTNIYGGGGNFFSKKS